ncbi:MAG: sugar ABC transporter ATP-binding protein [Chloroflexi bacterium]|nr:sugar ABC transporter ATP-binding protein [Chloroflexota bacterium]
MLEIRGLTKAYPGTVALDGVDFDACDGMVNVIVGENGAGKSTLVKIVAGAVQKDAGTIAIDGERVDISDPHHAQRLGIAVIYQEFSLLPELSIAENIFLGREAVRALPGVVDFKKMRALTDELLASLGLNVPSTTPVRELTNPQRQMVEIAKALSQGAKILLMDEPSAVLTEAELVSLYRAIDRLKERGVAIVYISHRLDDVFRVADRITVLKDGQLVGSMEAGKTNPDAVVAMMVGREIDYAQTPRDESAAQKTIMEVRGYSRGNAVRQVSFQLRTGEILGLAGLVGSGRTELARLIFGADRKDSGELIFEGKKVEVRRPSDAIRLGIGLLPEDRKTEGLLLEMSVKSNVCLAGQSHFQRFGILNGRRETRTAEQFVKNMRIRTPSVDQLAMFLSGGTQQKVVLAKWLATECKVVILDEPTRGIDVGARAEIYQILRDLRDRGYAIVVISSDLPEVVRLCDRTLVMYKGRIVKELSRQEATVETLLAYSVGHFAQEGNGHANGQH